MRLLDGPGLGRELPTLCRKSRKIRIAVAFWGEGALGALGLDAPLHRARIVCNLRRGGTNPNVIRALMDAGAEMRHSDDLHAKLYLFDDHAIIGSSNVSANGLSFQKKEVVGWDELNVLFNRRNGPFANAEHHFQIIWDRAGPIGQEDLKEADEAWSRRRRAGFMGDRSKEKDILSALTNSPEIFNDQRIYLVITKNIRSDETEKLLEEERNNSGLGGKLDCFESWDEMPTSATFVCFQVGPREGVEFGGFWRSPESMRMAKNSEDKSVQFVDKMESIKGIMKIGNNKEWRKIIRKINNSDDSDDFGALLEFGHLYKKYINNK